MVIASRQREVSIEHVQRAGGPDKPRRISQDDHVHPKPTRRAVEGRAKQRRECFQHVGNEQVDRREGDQEDSRKPISTQTAHVNWSELQPEKASKPIA